MRKWYKFIISNRYKEDIKDRSLFTNYQLIENNKNFQDIFNFEKLKKMKFFSNSIIF